VRGLTPDEYHLEAKGTDLVVKGNYGRLQLPGAYNVENALAALAAAEALGAPMGKALAAICAISFVPGRYELVDQGQPFRVIIDYAAEPAAMQQLYAALRLSPRARLIHVLRSRNVDPDFAAVGTYR
jgi:UDP-N-acetylmuramoyl-L-alanyl-D-glutamate--2,6-diaminopimelate ligase